MCYMMCPETKLLKTNIYKHVQMFESTQSFQENGATTVIASKSFPLRVQVYEGLQDYD